MMIYGIVPDDVPGAFLCEATGLTVVPDDWHPANTTPKLWDELRRTMRLFGRNAPITLSEWQSRPQTPPKPKIYFIGGDGTPIKIGFSNMPQSRLTALQTGHWTKLSILALVEGDVMLERDYHKRFAAHRLHGEWFTRCPEIEAEIARLGGGA